MKKILLLMIFICLPAGHVLGQQGAGEPNQLDLDRYKAQFLGYLDEAGTIQIYAMAKVNQRDEAAVRSVPHQEAIAFGKPGEQLQVIGKFEGALWVYMAGVKFPPQPRTLYFAVMQANKQLRYFKYNPETRKSFAEIAGEGEGNDALALSGLKTIAQRPPVPSEKGGK